MNLENLIKIIDARSTADPSESWTAKLLSKGPEKCAEKFGEEAVEAIIEAVKGNNKELISEAESQNALNLGKYFALVSGPNRKKYKNHKPLNKNELKYNNSGLTSKKLNIDQLKKILANIDKNV